jgi:hypothetical protein
MTFEQWFQSLTTEQLYDFDSEGRGYKKDAGVMMRLAWDAATAEHEAEKPLTLSDEQIEAVIRRLNVGLTGFRGWGWKEFARAVLAAAQEPRA